MELSDNFPRLSSPLSGNRSRFAACGLNLVQECDEFVLRWGGWLDGYLGNLILGSAAGAAEPQMGHMPATRAGANDRRIDVRREIVRSAAADEDRREGVAEPLTNGLKAGERPVVQEDDTIGFGLSLWQPLTQGLKGRAGCECRSAAP